MIPSLRARWWVINNRQQINDRSVVCGERACVPWKNLLTPAMHFLPNNSPQCPTDPQFKPPSVYSSIGLAGQDHRGGERTGRCLFCFLASCEPLRRAGGAKHGSLDEVLRRRPSANRLQAYCSAPPETLIWMSACMREETPVPRKVPVMGAARAGCLPTATATWRSATARPCVGWLPRL